MSPMDNGHAISSGSEGSLPPVRVLLVDDEPDVLWQLINFLQKEGCSVEVAERADAALEMIPDYEPHMVFMDVRMPGMSGLEAMRIIREEYPEIIVFILTAHDNIKDAVQAIKTGAYDYFAKPYYVEEIKFSILRALEEKRLKEQNRRLEEQMALLRRNLEERFDFPSIITADPLMFNIFDQLSRVAKSDLSVLITGEHGTGKDLVARAIHFNSHRREAPFMPIDCAAIPDTLFESQMFGHVKGSFTGADQTKTGLFVMAQGGSLFLDELGNLRLEAQGKILRAIQERKVLPVGAKEYLDLDLRLITATNTNLDAAINEGKFREDLYFRIKQFHVHLPPLRERVNDIKILAGHFVQEIRKGNGKEGRVQEISTEAMDVLMDYPWPGNIRELKNVIQSASVMAEERIMPEHLYLLLRNPPKETSQKMVKICVTVPAGATFKRMQKIVLSQAGNVYIEKVLKDNNYQERLACYHLNISHKAMRKMMEEYGIAQRQDYAEGPIAWYEKALRPGMTFKELDQAIGRGVERYLIIKALSEARGKKARAARSLSIDNKTLYLKMDRFGITPEDIRLNELPDYINAIIAQDPECPFRQRISRIRKEMETRLIMVTLRQTHGDKAKAARLLQTDYKTLFNKIRQYDLTQEI